MQLKLEAVRDINVLVASGPIEPANFAVLKAGLKKLFKEGKNKIILELPDSSTLSTEILRELAVMNLLASELAGQILLAGISPLTRAKIESFSKPPVVRCFASRADAVEFFHPKPSEEKPAAAAAPAATPAAPATPTATPASAPAPEKKMDLGFLDSSAKPEAAAASPTQNADNAKQMKSDIRAREINDLGELRKRLNEVEAENKELMSQLTKLVMTRRDPPDLDSWKEKVARLEKELADAIAAAQNAAGAKK